MLQFITDTNSAVLPAEQVKRAIAGGCRWVQISMPSASDEDVSKVVEEIKPLCLKTETFLLLDERVELAKTLDVGGVHLGKGTMPPSKARIILGPAAVIGVTVSNVQDIIAVRGLDIDYLMIAPFAVREGSDAEGTALGIEGIRDINLEMERLDVNIGHVACGGVRLEDVDALMQAGANGIAVSSAIADAPDIEKAAKAFVDRLAPFYRLAERFSES